MGRLDNKTAIVTGAGQGIGKGVALAFATEGADVVIAELNPETAERAGDEVGARGARALVCPADVRQRPDAEQVVAATLAEFGKVDVLVNNAVANIPASPLESLGEADLALAWQSALVGTLNFMQACFPHVKERGGKIINFGSSAGVDGMAYMGAYSVAKEAIRTLTKVGAREWGQYRIYVNTVCPFGASPGYEAWAASDPDMIAGLVAAHPLRQGAGDCERDIGRALVFLASSDSDFVTGQTLFVDGGQTMR